MHGHHESRGMIKRWATAVSIALVLGGATGCGDSTSSERSRAVEGAYRLIALNGFGLPLLDVVYSPGDATKLSVKEGALSLHDDGTYQFDLTVGNNSMCYHDAGTFTVSGSRIDFHSTQQYPVALSTSRAYTGGQLSAVGMTFNQVGADPLSFEFLTGDTGTTLCHAP